MPDKSYTICPNCQHKFKKEFDYCPHCGQANKDLNLNFRFIFSEFLSANFNLDSKILLTLKLLLLKPGMLSREFLAGKRTKYISPIRLYLLVSLVYFFILSVKQPSSDIVQIGTDVEVTDSIATKDEKAADFVTVKDGFKESDSLTDLEKFIMKKLKMLDTKEGNKAFWQSLRKTISTGMFLLMPLTALILMALFYKGSYYFEHLIFVINLQSVLFIISILYNLITWIGNIPGILILEFMLMTCIIFCWIKNFYNLKTRKAIWKTILFLFLFSLLLLVFFIIVIVFSVIVM